MSRLEPSTEKQTDTKDIIVLSSHEFEVKPLESNLGTYLESREDFPFVGDGPYHDIETALPPGKYRMTIEAIEGGPNESADHRTRTSG